MTMMGAWVLGLVFISLCGRVNCDAYLPDTSGSVSSGCVPANTTVDAYVSCSDCPEREEITVRARPVLCTKFYIMCECYGCTPYHRIVPLCDLSSLPVENLTEYRAICEERRCQRFQMTTVHHDNLLVYYNGKVLKGLAYADLKHPIDRDVSLEEYCGVMQHDLVKRPPRCKRPPYLVSTSGGCKPPDIDDVQMTLVCSGCNARGMGSIATLRLNITFACNLTQIWCECRSSSESEPQCFNGNNIRNKRFTYCVGPNETDIDDWVEKCREAHCSGVSGRTKNHDVFLLYDGEALRAGTARYFGQDGIYVEKDYTFGNYCSEYLKGYTYHPKFYGKCKPAILANSSRTENESNARRIGAGGATTRGRQSTKIDVRPTAKSILPTSTLTPTHGTSTAVDNGRETTNADRE